MNHYLIEAVIKYVLCIHIGALYKMIYVKNVPKIVNFVMKKNVLYANKDITCRIYNAL